LFPPLEAEIVQLVPASPTVRMFPEIAHDAWDAVKLKSPLPDPPDTARVRVPNAVSVEFVVIQAKGVCGYRM
jgi:hypothetical protein